jgi:tRNA nucleotidyltransferase/poly(A) polymerase
MEWQKILAGQNAPDVIERMARDGVLDRFLPGKWSGQAHRMFAQRHSLCSTLNPLERFALLLAENDSIEVERTLKHLKLSKKDRKKVETIHQRFGRVPKNTLADLRVYRSVLQKRSKNHLEMEKVIRESGLKIPKMDSVNSEEIDVLLHRLEELEPLRAGDESIVDGHWIMQRTGLGKGIVLGRLKMWLHRIQIERDLADSDAVEAALCSLNWEHANDAHWPKVEF